MSGRGDLFSRCIMLCSGHRLINSFLVFMCSYDDNWSFHWAIGKKLFNCCSH